MRVYSSLSEALNETARELFSRGIRNWDLTRQGRRYEEPARELRGYCYAVTGKFDYKEFFEIARKITGKDFHRQEIAETWFREMISSKCSNPQKFWFKHPDLQKYFEEFCADPEYMGLESYTYCERVSWQLDRVINLLAENPGRRAAIIAVWRPETDLLRVGRHRVPCSMFYQFIATNTGFNIRLDIIYVQRSCDFVWFYPFDVYRACRLLEHVVDELNHRSRDNVWDRGHLIHFIGSLHAYESDIPDRWKW